MKNIVSDTIKEVQYRRMLKKSFEPRKEFMDNSRALFLDEVAKRRIAPLAPQLAWHVLGIRAVRYTVAFVAFALIGTTGLVAYADNTNVKVASPLYSLKRVGEQVRLVATPAAKESEIRKELAQRRATELVEIEKEQRPDVSGDVDQLRKLETKEKELRAEFRTNVEKIEEHADRQTTVLPVTASSEKGLCQAAEVVERHSDNGKSERYKKFEDRCKELLKSNDASISDSDRSSDNRSSDIRKADDTSQSTVQPATVIPRDDRSGDIRPIETPKTETIKSEDTKIDDKKEDESGRRGGRTRQE